MSERTRAQREIQCSLRLPFEEIRAVLREAGYDLADYGTVRIVDNEVMFAWTEQVRAPAGADR